MFDEALVDPRLNKLYAQLHAEKKYGTSGINFLPEAVLYFVNNIATGKIEILPNRAATILDYGCGQSDLGKGLGIVLSGIVHSVQHETVNTKSVLDLLSPAFTILTAVMKDPWTLQNAQPLFPDSVHVLHYEPAISGYERLPKGRFTYVMSTDVVEHMPDVPRENFGNSVLRANVEKIDAISDNLYLNVSCRQAVNTLPNGESSHCTIWPAKVWKTYLSNIVATPFTPVLSRDLTSCSFIKGTVLPETKVIAYSFIDIFGAIDLIPYPPKEEMEKNKLQRLLALQPHKGGIIDRTIPYWQEQDPSAANRPEFRRLIQALQKKF